MGSKKKSVIAKVNKIKPEKLKDNLKTPKQKSSQIRISTGMNKFDKLIEGGFEKNSVNLIFGGSGSGKTIFAMQYLMEGIKKGEPVLYITFEEKKNDFYKNMLDFGWNLEKYEKEKKFTFLEYSPEKVKMMLDEGGGFIENIVLRNKIQRIVIDSISSFSLLFDDELSKRQAALALFDIIRKWSCTSLLTLQENPGSIKNQNISSIEFEADSIILFYFLRIENESERQRFFEILKMRGTKHSTSVYQFDISKKGIIIKKVSKKALGI